MEDEQWDLQSYVLFSPFLTNDRRLEELHQEQTDAQAQRTTSLLDHEANIDFSPSEMDMNSNYYIPSTNQITLTPPKLHRIKRAFREVKTDLRIELSNEFWKRQCTDLTTQVCKRPPLPCLLEWDCGMSELPVLSAGYQDELLDFLQYHTTVQTGLMKDGSFENLSSVG